MKGITFIPTGEITPEIKEKLRIADEKRKARLKQMVEEVENGKFDHIIKTL